MWSLSFLKTKNKINSTSFTKKYSKTDMTILYLIIEYPGINLFRKIGPCDFLKKWFSALRMIFSLRSYVYTSNHKIRKFSYFSWNRYIVERHYINKYLWIYSNAVLENKDVWIFSFENNLKFYILILILIQFVYRSLSSIFYYGNMI